MKDVSLITDLIHSMPFAVHVSRVLGINAIMFPL